MRSVTNAKLGDLAMSNTDIFVSAVYVFYVMSPALRDEFLLRSALFVTSLGFATWGLWMGSWPVVIANTLFCLLSLRQMYRAYQERRPVELSVDAATAGALVFPSMSDRDLQALWAGGHDYTAPEVNLTTRGERLDHLFLVLEGELLIELASGETIVRPAPAVIGEISTVSFAEDRAANATVMAKNARMRVWEKADIVALQQERPSMAAPFLRGLSAQMATRLPL